MRVGIALGSNLGDRAACLRAAVAAIETLAEPPIYISRVYETVPVDCPPDSPDFLNAAMEIGYSGDLMSLFHQLQSIERAHLRPAVHDRNSPRTVDLDILYADDLTLDGPDLTIPHPRLMDRMFVLRPLCDIVPDRCLPGFSESFSTRMNGLHKSEYRNIVLNEDIILD